MMERFCLPEQQEQKEIYELPESLCNKYFIDYFAETYQVSRLVAKLCWTSTRKRMIRNQWNLVDTGGGCTAWEFKLDDGRYFLITDAEGAVAACMLDQCVTIGFYDPEGEYYSFENHILYDILEAWEGIILETGKRATVL